MMSAVRSLSKVLNLKCEIQSQKSDVRSLADVQRLKSVRSLSEVCHKSENCRKSV